MSNDTQAHDHVHDEAVHEHDAAADGELGQALDAEHQRNCDTVASASEDLHHRNLARMALLRENHGVEVSGLDLLNLKYEILIDELVGQDHLRRLLLGFHFQQAFAEHLSQLESGHEPPDQE